jgi:DNA (cytosine-5)-methyltransferase 1
MGWQPAAFSEIDKFPSSVLAHHYPDVPNVGDMMKYKEWDIGAIDLLVGGTPCQSFSVAGLRKGMEDPRGNLALVYCGILDHFRPRWFVWENVPGVLSSNGGRDFGSFLGALAQLGYGFAYRVLDAQFFGVAQRRRRVFVVGYLGDWRPPAAVLFERQSLRRDTEPSRETRQKTTASTPLGLGSDGQLARALNACKTAAGRMDVSVDTFVASHYRKAGRAQSVNHAETWVEDEISNTLNCFDTGDVRAVDIVTQPVMQSMAVRRLTPTECERLQGFPDGYTNIKENCPDGPRYKALGNSMAVPVMRWIGERINGQNAI